VNKIQEFFFQNSRNKNKKNLGKKITKIQELITKIREQKSRNKNPRTNISKIQKQKFKKSGNKIWEQKIQKSGNKKNIKSGN
jgi:hypothetical protein